VIKSRPMWTYPAPCERLSGPPGLIVKVLGFVPVLKSTLKPFDSIDRPLNFIEACHREGSVDFLVTFKVHSSLILTGLGLMWNCIIPFTTTNKDVRTRNLDKTSTKTQIKSRKWAYSGTFRISSVSWGEGRKRDVA
jgi:hypothetical protein